MKEKINKQWRKQKNGIIAALGIILLLGIAVFCYNIVGSAIVESEQKSLLSLAKVNAQSLETSIQSKRDLIYAALSGDMDNEEEIQRGILKIGERGSYISLSEQVKEEDWEQKLFEEAGARPGEVVIGPVRQTGNGYYVLYMVKAVYIQERLAGYVQIEFNLDELYKEEQALSSLQLSNAGYCIVKSANGETIMPSSGEGVEGELSITRRETSGCQIISIYEPEKGVPTESTKLIAFETISIDNLEMILYIIEDYDQVIQPIERIALYFCLLGMGVLLWMGFFIHRITAQKKEEAQLIRELEHEKELNKANEALKNQESLMEKYNHSKTMEVLTGAIAHEFNNLMTPIMLYADLMEENDVVAEEMEEEIKELKSSAERCEELAKQLLSYSRQGRAEKVLTEYNATFAMREGVNIIEKLIPSNIKLKTSICKTSYYIKGQVGALNQILLNLTTNAVHAMKEGGTLSIQFGLSTDNDNIVRLVVEDTGSGIPREIRQSVFQPFFTTKEAGEGTGIGLTVVQRLTQEHGGTVRATTEEGKGTRFILDFPRLIEKSND